MGSQSPGGGVVERDATSFTLPATDGSDVSLSEYRGRDVLLYFNEGVGCDACFYQMVEIEKNQQMLDDKNLTVLPIVANPMADTQSEVTRFGLRTPFLIDADKRVSDAYGVLGTGMHADLPGHSFVLVDGSGRVKWQKEYPSMFVSTRQLMASLPLSR